MTNLLVRITAQHPHTQLSTYHCKITVNLTQLTIKSGGVVLYTSQVQVVIPPLCVFIHTVMLTLSGWCLIVLPFAAINEKQKRMRILSVNL